MKNVSIIQLLVLGIVVLSPSLSFSQEGAMGRGQHRARVIERLKSQGFTGAQIQEKLEQRRAKREERKELCKSQGLTREQCRAQFGKGRHRPQ